MNMKKNEKYRGKKYRAGLGFPDYPEETIKQKLIDPKGLLATLLENFESKQSINIE